MSYDDLDRRVGLSSSWKRRGWSAPCGQPCTGAQKCARPWNVPQMLSMHCPAWQGVPGGKSDGTAPQGEKYLPARLMTVPVSCSQSLSRADLEKLEHWLGSRLRFFVCRKLGPSCKCLMVMRLKEIQQI